MKATMQIFIRNQLTDKPNNSCELKVGDHVILTTDQKQIFFGHQVIGFSREPGGNNYLVHMDGESYWIPYPQRQLRKIAPQLGDKLRAVRQILKQAAQQDGDNERLLALLNMFNTSINSFIEGEQFDLLHSYCNDILTFFDDSRPIGQRDDS